MSRAIIYLDREEAGKVVHHLVAACSEGSPLQALRAAKAHVEAKWEFIGPLISEGQTLRIEVSR
jgi:hypothetical protein